MLPRIYRSRPRCNHRIEVSSCIFGGNPKKIVDPSLAVLQRNIHDEMRGHYYSTTAIRWNPTKEHNHAMFEQQMMDLKEEREALFGFTVEEVTSWSRPDSHQIPRSTMDSIEEARNNHFAQNDTASQKEEVKPPTQRQPFTHLSHQGDSPTMVDVGHKEVTRRTAKAQSTVVFPPQVMDAFGTTNGEMVGPKGPIFATAKLAGIMASKRTSELIPLCHPLPLDKVKIDITLVNNHAVIQCECFTTHKTGVEMEALMGASVAALTIYDMVKAVSHSVEIQGTQLISKTGGKRTIIDGKEELSHMPSL